MKSSRALALLAAAVVGLCAPLAHAAPTSRPQVVDPAGDALAPGFDVVSAQLTTTGVTTSRKVGRRTVTTYKPKNLVATVTLADAPSTTPGTSIQLWADTTACNGGSFQFQYTPGTVTKSLPGGGAGDLFISGCGTDNGTGPAEYLSDVQAQVSGKTIKWTMPLADLGSDLPLSSVFSSFRVYADLNDPVTGLAGTQYAGEITGEGDVDYASADVTWKLG